MCTVKPYHILAKRFGHFAVRLPSLSQGKWTWVVAQLLIFLPMFYTGCKFINIMTYIEEIHHDDLDDGYNVGLKLNRQTIILISMVKCIFKTRNCSHSYNLSGIISRNNEIKIKIHEKILDVDIM